MNVDANLLQDLMAYLKQYRGIEQIILFGSRARGDNSERSDYDIAVSGAVSPKEQSEIRYFCSEVLRTLHKVDIIFLNDRTYPKLKENIQKEGVVLYGKSTR